MGNTLNIAIDARSLNKDKTGVGNYIANLTASLGTIDQANHYWIATSTLRHRVKKYPLLSSLGRIIYFVIDNFIFPLHALWRKADLLHCPAFILPLWNFRYKKVITIHDLGFYIFGGQFARGWHTRHMRFMLPYSISKADKIIAVSQATKQQIVDIFKINPEKVAVTYEGVSEKYRVIKDRAEVNKTLLKYRLQAPYILFVGTMDPRKNLVRLIQAFQKVKLGKKDLKLVIVGRKGELYTDELNKLIASGDIILTGYVEEEDMVCLYNGASVFVFPSLYEGFGLPILEAMACGTPVITSNVYSMPEVAGDAALLVDPENVEALAKGIKRLQDETALRSELIAKGLTRASAFTWDKTATATLTVYQEVMDIK